MATVFAPIATRDDFTLLERTDLTKGEWRSLKLVKAKKAPKRNWWMGWNGQRLARNKDTGLLAEHNPEIYQWVVDTLKRGVAT